MPHLLDATLGGVPFPLAYPMVECQTNHSNIRSNKTTDIITRIDRYLFVRQNDGSFGMKGTDDAQGVGPAIAAGYYVVNGLFFDATGALFAFWAILSFFVITINVLIIK